MEVYRQAVIKVLGVGGGGGNAVNHMISKGFEDVSFHFMNTDFQALNSFQDRQCLQLGPNTTKGLGAGARPDVGEQAARESVDEIRKAIDGADMVFITAGMGGGTGTGAAPVVAEVAREMGILTVGVVTTPFSFEGKKRMNLALEGIGELSHHVDSLITIPNNKLLPALGQRVSLVQAFAHANDILANAVHGVSDLIVRPGMINVDFADVRTVMSNMGIAMMGYGCATGDNRAEEAVEQALFSPLLDDVPLESAKGILVNITAGDDFELGDFTIIGDRIQEIAGEDADVIIGTVTDPSLNNTLHVTLVATGLAQPNQGTAPVKVQDDIVKPVARATSNTPPSIHTDSRSDSRVGRGGVQSAAQKPVNEADRQSNNDLSDYDLLDIPAFLRRRAL